MKRRRSGQDTVTLNPPLPQHDPQTTPKTQRIDPNGGDKPESGKIDAKTII
jgi:hypothetical protein